MKLRTLFVLALFSFFAAAQEFGSLPEHPAFTDEAPAMIEKGQQVFLRGENLGKSTIEGEAASLLDMLTTPFTGTGDDNQSLVEASSRVDELGLRHVRVEQYINGLPVVGARMNVHSDKSGDIYAINGILADTEGVATEASVDARRAINYGMVLANIKGGSLATAPELTYVMDANGRAFLAWVADVKYVDEVGPQLDRLFVDATGGKKFARHPQHHFTKNRRTYTANNSSNLPGTLRRSEGQGQVGDGAVDAAHDNAGRTYDYYSATFGRDSYDNRGATMVSSAHYQYNLNNAYWNGSQMIYGDGDGQTFSYLSGSLDVVAHELTHAVTSSESGLIYQNESGALNEALSDIFGVSCSIYFSGINSNTWLLGEEVYTPGTPGDALRYMNDPARDGSSRDYYPDRYTGSSDNGGVHINSGIANLAFYLMVQGGTHPRGKTSVSVPSIGVDKAQKIFYRAQTTYLSPSSNFAAARAATESAASDLYDAATVAAVGKAWQAVGVGGGTTPGGCSGASTYTGYLASGNQAFQPNGNYYYAGAGSHVGQLDGPNGTDFDLYLWKWNGSWQTVAQGATASADESVSYNGTSGYYVWRVHAYSGSGNYSLCLNTP